MAGERRRRLEAERRGLTHPPDGASAPSPPGAVPGDPVRGYHPGRRAPVPGPTPPVSPWTGTPGVPAGPRATVTLPEPPRHPPRPGPSGPGVAPAGPSAAAGAAVGSRRRRRRRRQRNASDVATLVLTLSMTFLVWTDAPVPGRPLLSIAFVLLMPGLPAAWLLRLPSMLAIGVLVVATSVATTLVASEILLAAGVPGARTWVTAVSVVSLVLVGVRYLMPHPEDAQPQLDRLTEDDAPSNALDTRSLGSGAGLLVALACFVGGLATTDLDGMTGSGLISAMSPPIVLALLVLAAVAVNELTRPVLQEVWLAVTAAAVVFVLFGYQVFSERAASLPVAWFHVGFVAWIQTHGQVLHGFDARFSWPGFFAAAANLTLAAGEPDAAWALRFAPLIYNLLWGPPLLLIARSLTRSRRVGWLAVMLFYCGNWYQQDYFSPQATAMILYLSIIGILVWLTSGGPPERFNPFALLRNWRTQPYLLGGVDVIAVSALAGVIWLLVVAVIITHQLTPVLLVLVLVVLRAFGRLRYPNLWLATGVAFVGWVAYGATDFWTGHLNEIVGDVGNVSSTVGTGVAARIRGDEAHLRMQYVRVGLCLAFAVAGLLGLFLRRRSRGHWVVAGMAYSPFALVALQSYGGEVLLRVFLFAMPGLAILTAEALRVLLDGRRLSAVALTGLLTVGGTWFVAARGANEGFERVTPSQVLAAKFVVRTAGAEGGIAQFNTFSPLTPLWPTASPTDRLTTADVKIRGIASLRDDPGCASLTPAQCVLQNDPRLLYVTSGQVDYEWQVNGLPKDWASKAINQLVAGKRYRIALQAPDVVVLVRYDVTVRASAAAG